jgi:hypothetical protein
MFGRVIIVNNEGTIIFGNSAVIKINETSVSTNGSNTTEYPESENSESDQNETNASASGIVTSHRSKRNRFKLR